MGVHPLKDFNGLNREKWNQIVPLPVIFFLKCFIRYIIIFEKAKL